jgi:Tfp pilus assembly protein PilF
MSFLFLVVIAGSGVYMLYASRVRGKGKAQSTEGRSGEGPLPSTSHLPHGAFNLMPFYRLVGFGILWFFITLSVESSVIPIVDVIFEHRVYLPSVGVFMAITTSVFMITERLKRRRRWIERAVICVCAVLVVALSGTTYARNILWQDEVRLWVDVVKKSPKKARGYNNLGNAYEAEGLTEKAVRQYQVAIKHDPDYAEAYINLGIFYLKSNMVYKAIEYSQKAISINPGFPKAHNNIGICYALTGQPDEAIKHFRAALEMDPYDSKTHNNLGNVLRSQGEIDQSVEHFRAAIQINPDYSEAYYNLGLALRAQGKAQQAAESFRSSFQLRSD